MKNDLYKYNLFKIYLLQMVYKKITTIIYNLINHINIIDSYYLLKYEKKNEYLCDIFYIIKNINKIYNIYILQINKSAPINKNLIELIKNTNENNYDLFLSHTELFFKNKIFEKENKNILKIINDVGYYDIINLLSFNNFTINKGKLNDLLIEINNYFIPTSINIFLSTNNIEFYWRIPTKYSEEDILQLNRELWILKSKEQNNSYYFKIEGFFKSDILSTQIKTAQINFNYLYLKKKNIIIKLKEKSKEINDGFIKKFLKYDYIGNLYCLSIDEYIIYIQNSYKLYLELCKSSFINIMKNFINNGSKLHNLYYIILLLLLGNNNNADIASLLINLTKEKKINSITLYNLIYKNLSFYLQLKLKKGNINIKNELEKIKLISIESIDYQKILLSLKNIPENIKVLTLDKIEEMKAQNNEYYKQKTFVDHILKYPWSSKDNSFKIFSENNSILKYLNDIKHDLNNLTYGHDEAKMILLQTVAKWITDPSSGGKPLGFVGPPGVGKTLLAKSISKVLKIPFAEITLGGQNDGELLHGHGYTYSGSQPGLIVKKMVEMGHERCILFFDELDKTASKHGINNEIFSILIHLTDSNMNKSFQDRFFQGVDFPLDKVIMIFSYNDSEKIDPILLDRLTEINIQAYTLFDKINIIKNFIIPELKLNMDIKFSDDIIEYIIENYTNESGIRNIKRHIEKIFLTLNLEILTEKIDINNYELNINEINRILLKPKIENIKIHLKSEIGIVNALYATNNGNGGIIPIQVFNNVTSSCFEIKLTGKQGDVMKESVQCSLTCAINYIKLNLIKYNIENFDEYFNKNFKNGFHIHAPSTSTPKDGPSAGVAFTSAFISRILNIPVNNEIGMTGEIELTGKITKIGGLDFKLIGAKRAGIKIVYIPSENIIDLNEIRVKYPLLFNENFKVNTIDNINELFPNILQI